MALTARIPLLILLICLAQGLADVFRYNICPGPSGRPPFTVIRQNPIRIRYNLLRGSEAGFPDLSDKFYLNKPQRVHFEYSVTVWSISRCHFRTTLVIDGTHYPQFNYMTNGVMERTHYVAFQLWLQEGFHYAYVEYYTNGNIIGMPANTEGGWFNSRLQIQYLEYS